MGKGAKDAEEEGELDYHVTFPPAISTDVEGEDGQSVPKHEPVVMLFGWAGCADKNLAKYSAIHQSKGYTTIRYTAPRSKIFGNPDSIRDTAYKLLELLFDLGLEENPIIFHVFSNGGSFIYRHIMELLTNGENPQFSNLKVAGSILDSTPSDPRIWTAMKAIFHSRNTPILTTIFLMLMFAVLAILDLVLPKAFRKASSLSTHLQSIEGNPSKKPQLFLYSNVDNLCDYKRVEEVIARRQELGVEVWQVCWNDSEHVAHFLKHKDEYMKKVLDFIKFCVEEQDSS
ncbi:Transmembrane protein 53 [Holothuria leucospilota]|uniref:Transmembrane protein 53 n=1 Tax=Holothuria leucospilota TaxID=206669 RepID=A0A9Q1HCB5_HOLLE|nr:Transmembrane protein 53 [Holothuria leucospilota]